MKCIEARSKEMKSGYYNLKEDKAGNKTNTYITDSRKVFTASVDSLKSILSTEFKKFPDRKKEIDSLKEKKDILFNEYAYVERTLEKEPTTKRMVWVINNKKIMPEIKDKVIIRNPQIPSRAFVIEGGWDLQVNGYWNELVIIYDSLFEVLNILIDDLGYFKRKRGF